MKENSAANNHISGFFAFETEDKMTRQVEDKFSSNTGNIMVKIINIHLDKDLKLRKQQYTHYRIHLKWANAKQNYGHFNSTTKVKCPNFGQAM